MEKEKANSLSYDNEGQEKKKGKFGIIFTIFFTGFIAGIFSGIAKNIGKDINLDSLLIKSGVIFVI